jgi:hypothetical protein
MNNNFKNLALGFALCGGLFVMANHGVAQNGIKDKQMEQRVAALESLVQTQQAKIAALENKLKYVTVNGTDMLITGANLHIRNEGGATDTTNGLGNLILGYHELGFNNDRSGSHNILIGKYLNYGSYGGILTGEDNSVKDAYGTILSSYGCNSTMSFNATIAAGYSTINANRSAIVAGDSHTLNGHFSGILGGQLNTIATGVTYSAGVGGYNNKILSGAHNTNLGGYWNQNCGSSSTISAGYQGLIKPGVAAGSISGGDTNTVQHNYSTVGGGHDLNTTINSQFKGGGLTG